MVNILIFLKLHSDFKEVECFGILYTRYLVENHWLLLSEFIHCLRGSVKETSHFSVLLNISKLEISTM
jgi:hypothetical protein